jgi:hypothetical protein
MNSMKKLIKSLRKNNYKKMPIILPNTAKTGRNIVNFKMFEVMSPVTRKESFLKLLRGKVHVKVWYYLNRTEENPQGERKENVFELPTAEKYLGYIERETENIFLVAKTSKAMEVYSMNNGRVFFMNKFPKTTTNQEVKQYIAG